jgi:glycosyltransferase involved in cell wall biosynthesis
MHILYTISSIHDKYGGPSTSSVALLKALAKTSGESHRVTLFTSDFESAFSQLNGIQIISAAFIWKRVWLLELKSLVSIARRFNSYDIVHVNGYWNCFSVFIIILANLFRKPVILSPRGSLNSSHYRNLTISKKLYLDLFGRKQLRSLAGIHAQSQSEIESLMVPKILDSLPISIIDNGCNVPNLFDSKLAEIAFSFHSTEVVYDKHLLYFGRIHKIKNIRLQILALKWIVNNGYNYCLHVVGPDDGDLRPLKKFVLDLNLSDRVIFKPSIYGDLKYYLMRIADCVLLTSDFENNSNLALEVLASSGLLLARRSCVPQDFFDQKVSFEINPTPSMMGQSIINILNNKEIVSDTREKAKSYILLKKSWDERAKQMLAFYQNLVCE